MALSAKKRAQLIIAALKDIDPDVNDEASLSNYASSVSFDSNFFNILESSYRTGRPPNLILGASYYYTAEEAEASAEDVSEGQQKLFVDLSDGQIGRFFIKATILWWKRIHTQVRKREAAAETSETIEDIAETEVDDIFGNDEE